MRIVYASGEGGSTTRRLYVREIGQLEATPLRGTEGGNAPFFSPDGESVGFRTLSGDILKRVSVLGGPAVTIAELGAAPGGMSWGPDDSIVYMTVATDGLMRVPAVGGEPEVLTRVDAEQGSETDHRWPEVLPNGRGVLFTAWSGSDETSRLAVVSLESGEITYLLPGGSNPHYSPTGHIVYGVGGTLRAVGFDAERLELTSNNPVPVVENVRTTSQGAASFSLANDGSLVYVSGTGVTDTGPERTLVWVDREGLEQPVGAPPRPYSRPRVSPDGTRLAMEVQDPANPDVWIYDLARGTSTKLTFDEASDSRPLWSPTGHRVVFSSMREGERNLFWRTADATGPVERLTTSPNQQSAYAWAGDGQQVVFVELMNPGDYDIFALSVEGERTVEPLLQRPFSDTRPAVSPDGRWIAYDSRESGQAEVYVQSFPDLAGKWQISTAGGTSPKWGPDGRELFYRDGQGQAVLVVPIDTEEGFAAGTPEVLFEGPYLSEFPTGGQYDLAPDGQRFLMVKEGAATGDATPAEIVLVQNWFDELERLVPTDQ